MEVPKTHPEASRSTSVAKINDEMKTLFSHSAKTMVATAHNNMIIHVNPTASIADGQQPVVSSKNVMAPQAPPNNNHQANDVMNNINFNNAVFKKSIMTQQHQQQQQPQQTQPSSYYPATTVSGYHHQQDMDQFEHSAASLTFNDAYLSDDLAQMQVVDDKSLVDSLKTKFEMKKYYVLKIHYFFRGRGFC